MHSIHELLQQSEEDFIGSEPLVACSFSDRVSDSTTIRAVGGSTPRRNKGETVSFSLSVEIVRERIEERLTADELHSITKKFFDAQKGLIKTLTGGINVENR